MGRSRTIENGGDDHDQPLRDQADDFEHDLRAEMVRTGVISER